MRKRARSIVVLACLLLLGVEHEERGPRAVPPFWPGALVPVPDAFASVIRGADRATLYRVTGQYRDDWERYRNAPKIAGHPKIGEAQVPPALVADLARTLTTSTNYMRENETWACLPQPFYLIRFQRGDDVVDVVIHECGDVEMTSGAGEPWSQGLRPTAEERRLWQMLTSVMTSGFAAARPRVSRSWT